MLSMYCIIKQKSVLHASKWVADCPKSGHFLGNKKNILYCIHNFSEVLPEFAMLIMMDSLKTTQILFCAPNIKMFLNFTQILSNNYIKKHLCFYDAALFYTVGPLPLRKLLSLQGIGDMNKFQTQQFSLLVVFCQAHLRLLAQLGTFATLPASLLDHLSNFSCLS